MNPSSKQTTNGTEDDSGAPPGPAVAPDTKQQEEAEVAGVAEFLFELTVKNMQKQLDGILKQAEKDMDEAVSEIADEGESVKEEVRVYCNEMGTLMGELLQICISEVKEAQKIQEDIRKYKAEGNGFGNARNSS